MVCPVFGQFLETGVFCIMHARARILAVLGTRPEAIKFSPIIKKLRERGHEVIVVATGQHPDLGQQLLVGAGLSLDVDLGLHRQGNSPAELMGQILAHLPPVIAAYRPALLLVQGDTVSAFGGAVAGACARVPVGHVEAGLRTHDRDEPFPEEMHRCAITPLASLHFAPTPHAVLALEREGINADTIYLTGNSGIDALLAATARMEQDRNGAAMMRRQYGFIDKARAPLLLATVHRRENIGVRLASIAAGLTRLAGFMEAEIILPLHPNPAVADALRSRLEGVQGVHLLPPVNHATMVWLMRHARLLLTDSGGLQEEAPALGLRTLILRTVTERPEAVAAGVSELVPLSADAIVESVRSALAKPPLQPVFPFGDGNAATRIADGIDRWLGRAGAFPVADLSVDSEMPGHQDGYPVNFE